MNDLRKNIEEALVELHNSFYILKARYSKPGELSQIDYIWLTFSYNIYLQTKDLLALIDNHAGKVEKIQSSIYSGFRSILEGYFYIKLLLLNNDKKRIEIHFKAIIASSQGSNRTHIKSLIDLETKGKYFAKTGDIKIPMSLDSMKAKIREYENDISIINKQLGRDKRLIEVYKHVDQVCIEYDKLKGIVKLEIGKENESLVWQYNVIYRLVSSSVHQVLNAKEAVLDLLWLNKHYNEENVEVLSSILWILNDLNKLNEKEVE